MISGIIRKKRQMKLRHVCPSCGNVTRTEWVDYQPFGDAFGSYVKGNLCRACAKCAAEDELKKQEADE